MGSDKLQTGAVSDHCMQPAIADLQLYLNGGGANCSDDSEKSGYFNQHPDVILQWDNVLQWFSVRASWVHSLEIRNFNEDFAQHHDCPPGDAFRMLQHAACWQHT